METKKEKTKTDNKKENKTENKPTSETNKEVKNEDKSKKEKSKEKVKQSKSKENVSKAKSAQKESTKIFEANHLFSESILVNRMITKYMQIGFEAPLSKTFSPVYPNNKKGVIFLIPGILGATEYYTDFIVKVYEAVKIPIVIVSHGNHTRPTKALEKEFNSGHTPTWISASDTNWKHMHGIWGQVHHKLVFIHRFVGDETPLIIMGHSIGAEIAFRILKKNSYLAIIRIIMIMPLFEHIDCSPMASRYMAWLKLCRCVVPLFTLTIGMCPQSFQKKIIPMVMNQGFSIPDSCQEAATHFSHSVCANAATELFMSAVKTVHEIDFEVLEKFQKYFSIFYSEHDAWVPKLYFERLSALLSLTNIQMPWNNVSHYFFLDENDVNAVIEVIVSELQAFFISVSNIQFIPSKGKLDYLSKLY